MRYACPNLETKLCLVRLSLHVSEHDPVEG
jgi:hypothetical protein